MAHPYSGKREDKVGKARVKTVLKRQMGGFTPAPMNPTAPSPVPGRTMGDLQAGMRGIAAAQGSGAGVPQMGSPSPTMGIAPRPAAPMAGPSPVPGRTMADLHSGMRGIAAAQGAGPGAPQMGSPMPQRVAPTANPYSGGRGFQPGWLQAMMRMRGG